MLFQVLRRSEKRLGAALAHIRATDSDLVKLLDARPTLPAHARAALAQVEQFLEPNDPGVSAKADGSQKS